MDFSEFFMVKIEFQNSESSVFTKIEILGQNIILRFSRGLKT